MFAAALDLYRASDDEEVRAAIEEAGRRIVASWRTSFITEEATRVRELSQLHVTSENHRSVEEGGALTFAVPVAANGVNFVVIEAAQDR